MGFKPKWEAPPAQRTGRHATAYKLAKLIASRPGEWYAIEAYTKYRTAHNRASAIRTGQIKAFAEVGTFAVKVRQKPEGYVVYVKCIYVKAKEREHDANGLD